MKKLIVLFLCVFVLGVFNHKANASVEAYENMFDMKMVKYDYVNDKFYSDQVITLNEGVYYTVVATRPFFGDTIKKDLFVLEGEFFDITATNSSGETVNLNFAFEVSFSLELHYTTLKAPCDCTMKIDDFLITGLDDTEFRYDELIMFEGKMSDFKGFKKYVDLSGMEKVYNEMDVYTDIDNLMNIDTISRGLVAYDSQEGIIDNIEIVSNEYEGCSKPGVYKVVYRATDSANNYTNLVVNVNVEDKTKPVINGETYIDWELGNPCPTESEIIKLFTVTDNVDGDISSNLKIKNSALSTYSTTKEGEYIIILEVSDAAENVASKNVFLKVKDTTPPEVVVQDVTVNLSESFDKKLEGLASQVLVSYSDASNSFKTKYTYDEYVDNIGFTGTYTVTISITDGYNNTTVKTANMTILDDISPEFYMKTDLFTTTNAKAYNVSEVKRLISNKLTKDGILHENVQLISSDYFGNEHNPGEYEVKFMYDYNGHINYMVGKVMVEEAPESNYTYIFIAVAVVLVSFVVIKLYKRRRSVI